MLSNGNNHGILQGQIGRSLSNERNGAWATNNNPKSVQSSLGDSLAASGGANHGGGNGSKNRGGVPRSNMPGGGYRSTGRGNLGVSTPGGTNGQPIFLNAELKHVLTNNSRKTRGNNSLTMPLAT